ncbi:HEAT repeat protein-like protein, partial [Hortaea werneckii]
KAGFELDVSKLHALPSEQQSLYLLTYTADLVRHVQALDADGASAEQLPLKRELFQVIGLSSPPPTRVIRDNLGRCFAGIFSKGNRKLLYDSINELVAIIQGGKDKSLQTKHVVASCLGSLYEAAGDSAMSLSPLACTALLKAIKAASNDTGYRSAIFRALGKVIRGINTAIDEDIGRSIWKQARNIAGSDKSSLVQASACWCLEQLVRCTPYYDNSNDFDKLQSALYKALEGSSSSVRRAAASALAAELVKSYSEFPRAETVPRIKKPKKPKKASKGEELDEELDRASSPAPEKPATALSYTLLEMLKILSTHYCRPTTGNKARAGVAICYIKVLKTLGESTVEKSYGDIAKHLFTDILSHPSLVFNKYRQLVSRKLVRIILERVIGRMLGETAQLNACRFLTNEIIKDYPSTVSERPEPSKQVLIGAISALTSLIGSVDAAVGGIAEQCREGLLQAIQHPNFTVQVYAARALRAIVVACPQQLLPTVTICMNSVHRELNLLATPRQGPKRCVGYAHGLAAVLSASSLHPLYGSVDVYARVLQQATTLLKSSGSSDLRISSCQLQVAWIMIGGLMTLGPNFVKIHLSQLMLLWKNALPRPVAKENISQRTMFELSYLAHVREGLVNDPTNRLSSTLQLLDYEVMVRRRVFQCFSQLLTLSPPGSIETTAHSTILPLAVTTFSDAEYYSSASLSAAIASAAASFESIWDVGDNNGFGVTSLVQGLDVRNSVDRSLRRHWTSRQGDEDLADESILSPVGASAEYDACCCYLGDSTEADPAPPGAEAVNAAIAAFGLCLPLQAPRVQESTLEQISSSMGANALQKDPARKAAITVNISLAIATACKVTIGEVGIHKGDLRRDATENALQSILHICLRDSDPVVRLITADAIGALCCSSGSVLTDPEVNNLTDTIINNREPHVRAGCALALASIHNQLGGMAAGFHMKKIVGIIMSLAADTHPLVHFWALDSLAQVAESAGLNFSAFVSNAIGMLSQLYVSDGHNEETAVLVSSNMSVEMPVPAALARGIDSAINVLGPDLQDMAKPRDMILSLVGLFSRESSPTMLLESLRCLEHLSLYAPGHLEYAQYVQRLQADLDAENEEISQSALHSLSVLMRRDATEIVRTARPGLEDRLWEYLNDVPDQPEVKNIFVNWLHQTGASDPAEWIQRCNVVLTKTKAKSEQPKTAQTKDTAGPDIQDEEIAGFAAASGAAKEDESQAPTSTQELMKWQVRLFAMECLHSLIAMISKEAAIVEESPGEAALQSKVADVVRIAFSASTAGIAALRVVGMRIIDQVLKMFGRTPDPDFPEAMLLEQYQAQISSALTPAFAADSSPELAAAAVSVCATFIATGIVTDVDRMGRILKVLVTALENFSQDTQSASIGDLKGLSTNAQVMVRMAVFSAWAELQIASAEQRYLVDVVKPHIAKLVPLWLSSLREYSRLRFEPDISASLGTMAISDDLDTVYAALNRQTLLKFYQASWLSLVDAIASLIDEDSEFVFDALDDKQRAAQESAEGEPANGTNDLTRKDAEINYREEPVAFFFVLFGLAFESLAVRSNDDESVTRQRNLDILQAMKKILRPSVSGNAIYQEVIFSETVDLLSRMVLTESLSVQTVVVEIARNLCISHPSSRQGLRAPVNGETLSDDIEQLFELTRLIVLVLASVIPGLSETPVSLRLESSEEATTLVRTTLQALVDVSDVFPSIIKTDLHATILHIFVTILGTGACQAAVVPQSLPILRRFIASVSEEERSETPHQLRSAIARMLIILKNAQKRETDASLPCEKNTMLAVTVVLSAAPQYFTEERNLLSRFIGELIEAVEVPMTSRVAAGCVRTLLMAGVEPARLLPAALHFVTNPSDLEGLEDSRKLMTQTITMYASRVPEPQQTVAVVLVVNGLLEQASSQGQQSYQETATRLLELAAANSGTFRSAVTSLDSERKSLLEGILKSRAGLQRNTSDFGADREPTIALKMDFGS